MSKVYLNYINGKWVESKSKLLIESANPTYINDIVGYLQDSSIEDLNEAIQAAKNAKKMWKNLSYVERGKYLVKAAEILTKKVDEIACIATKEMGKIFLETKSEVLRGAEIFHFYAQEGLRKVGDIIPSNQTEKLLYTTRVPLGVIGVIAPWNFPIAIPVWKIAPALVYGNTVVFKPATETGVTGVLLAKVFEEAGLPAGVLNVITGKGSIIGEGISNHPDVDGVTFTGSNQIGKQVARNVSIRGARYQLEMGGKNSAIVLKDANISLSVEKVLVGAMKQTGQRCTATSRVFIEEDIYSEFKNKLLEKAKKIKIGSGFDEEIFMGPLASKNQLDNILSYIDIGKKEGATLVLGGEIPVGEKYTNGCFIEPTIFENVTKDMVIAREEIFGPVLCLIKVNNLNDALEQANDSQYGLSASIFTRDVGNLFKFIDEIEVGMVTVNGETGGVEYQAPFGGMKSSSSLSREQGSAAIEFFTIIKTVAIISER